MNAAGERKDDDAIVRHVVSLARALEIATVAEGLQSQAEVDRLVEVGCELGQGYHFSEPQQTAPVPAE